MVAQPYPQTLTRKSTTEYTTECFSAVFPCSRYRLGYLNFPRSKRICLQQLHVNKTAIPEKMRITLASGVIKHGRNISELKGYHGNTHRTEWRILQQAMFNVHFNIVHFTILLA